jgi:hypothetical protein
MDNFDFLIFFKFEYKFIVYINIKFTKKVMYGLVVQKTPHRFCFAQSGLVTPMGVTTYSRRHEVTHEADEATKFVALEKIF